MVAEKVIFSIQIWARFAPVSLDAGSQQEGRGELQRMNVLRYPRIMRCASLRRDAWIPQLAGSIKVYRSARAFLEARCLAVTAWAAQYGRATKKPVVLTGFWPAMRWWLGRNRRIPGEPLFTPFCPVTKKSGYGLGYECKKPREWTVVRSHCGGADSRLGRVPSHLMPVYRTCWSRCLVRNLYTYFGQKLDGFGVGV